MLLQGNAGTICFCQDCELYETCKHDFGKIHPLSLYVYRYMVEFESGSRIYPNGKSWEYEPDWFLSLLTAATNEYRTITAEGKNG
jgi:hypothetical protein